MFNPNLTLHRVISKLTHLQQRNLPKLLQHITPPVMYKVLQINKVFSYLINSNLTNNSLKVIHKQLTRTDILPLIIKGLKQIKFFKFKIITIIRVLLERRILAKFHVEAVTVRILA